MIKNILPQSYLKLRVHPFIYNLDYVRNVSTMQVITFTKKNYMNI